MRVFAALLCVALAAATESHVVDLTSANFQSSVENGDWFVEFYAPWCGYCKRLAPIWEDLGRSVQGRANIARVDCTEETDIANKYQIKSYPTILLLRSGGATHIPYNGDRSLEQMTRFLTEKNVLSDEVVELSYFDSRGRAEAIRLMLHDMKVTFSDTRVAREEWGQVKERMVREGRAPFGQMPALSFGSDHLVQSHAILRYLARKFALYGTNAHEQSLIDMISDGFEDLRRRYGTLAYDKDYKSKAAEYRDVTLEMWLGHYEKWLEQHSSGEEGGNGVYFVGNHPSWADYVGFDLIDANLRSFPDCLKNHTRLAAFHKTFAARPNIATYLASATRQNTHQNGAAAHFDNPANPPPLVF